MPAKEKPISVKKFIDSLDDQKKRECKKVMTLMRKATNKQAKMWGNTQVGFGTYHYKYESGREGDCFVVGFSPRKANLVIYIMPGFSKFTKQMKKLGKFKTGASCLYLKKLDDVDSTILEDIVSSSVKIMRKRYPCK